MAAKELMTAGMVLSVMPMGEYDRRIELLTSDLGRISAFARGARKPGSSMVSLTRVFAFGTFRLLQGKTAYILKGGTISSYFEELTADLDLACYGFYFLEVAQYFSRENQEAADMLKLLYYSLKALNLTSVPNRLVRCIYELKMLHLNGLCPPVDMMVSGQGDFAFSRGISTACRKACEHVISYPPEKQFTFVLSETILKEFERIVGRLMQQNVDRQFKSLPLLNQGDL